MEFTLFYTKYNNNQPCIKVLNFLRSKNLSMEQFQMFDIRDIPRRFAASNKEAAEEMVNELLEDGIIEKSYSNKWPYSTLP